VEYGCGCGGVFWRTFIVRVKYCVLSRLKCRKLELDRWAHINVLVDTSTYT
jgi:hypothetical protein